MSIKSVKLYHYPLSRSARVKFLLHEIYGDDFETVFMDMLKGAGRAPEFLAKNPNHAVPVLDITYEDGLFVHESRGTFFTLEGAEKEFTLIKGLPWEGGDTFDDLC